MTAMPPKKHKINQQTRLHTFFLNPYSDQRFTRCPKCGALTKARKKIFVIHVEPGQLLNLNMTGRYCPVCDLMILHQDVVESLMAAAFSQHDPSIIGNEYLIMGTLDRKVWRDIQAQPRNYSLVFDNLHVFKNVVTFEIHRGGWQPDNTPKKEN
jgi:uncharacterized C2H2 Zn-finger protein